MSTTPDALTERLDALERKHRRLQRGSLVLLVLVLLLGGWTQYSNVYHSRHAETDSASLHLWSEATRYAELTRDAETGDIELLQNSLPRVNRLFASEERSMLSLLGPSRIVGLANAGDQAVLILTSEDMQQGLRLGLDAYDEPFFDVIRDGER